MVENECAEHCERRSECRTCGKVKAPIGRSVPLAMGASMCDHECPGYREEPTPGHLWPGELADVRGTRETDE